MNRVLVIGCPGAGKTTFSKAVAKKLHLPLIYLDQHYWKKGWQETPENEWLKKVEDLSAKEKWVMDGNYGSSLKIRLEAADSVIFLDRSKWVCLWRAFKQVVFNFGKTREELPAGCPEHFDPEFFWFIYHFPKNHRPRILNLLSDFHGGKIHLIRSNKESKQFLSSL